MKKILSVVLALFVGLGLYFGVKAVTSSNSGELGEGSQTVEIIVFAEGEVDEAIVLNTDATNLKDALLEIEDDIELVYQDFSGDIYVTGFFGRLANEEDQEFYAFYVNDEMAMTGPGGEVINDGDVYRFELTTW